MLRHLESGGVGAQGAYEEMIQYLPELDQLALQLITLLMGGLKVDDVVSILCSVVNPYSELEIRKTLTDLAVIGLLIINGTGNDRIRVEHELVAHAVRRYTSEERALELKDAAVSAISLRLEQTASDAEYERLVDRLIGLVSPSEIRNRHDLLAHLIALIDRQSLKANYRYLIWLFGTPTCSQVLNLLPSYCAEVFLNAFQKTSQFDRGLAGVELIRTAGRLRNEKLALYEAKFLVQKFDYDEALSLLEHAEYGPERDLVFHNILLNLCRDEEARGIVDSLLVGSSDLDEYQCVILRNSAHLYEPAVAREILGRALIGFRDLGLEFGEATTLTNLGIVELCAGQTDTASTYFEESLQKLLMLDSNEAYQPLINLAVVKALQGNFGSADDLFRQSQATLPLSLRMDQLMLEFNRLVLSLMSEKVDVKEAHSILIQLNRNSLRIKDLRFRAIVNWFLTQFEAETESNILSDPSNTLAKSIMNSTLTGIEVFFDFQPFRYSIATGVFVLSPHWRY